MGKRTTMGPDPREKLRRAINKDILTQSQATVDFLDGFLKEFPDSETYSGVATRRLLTQLREAVLALSYALKNEMGQ